MDEGINPTKDFKYFQEGLSNVLFRGERSQAFMLQRKSEFPDYIVTSNVSQEVILWCDLSNFDLYE